MPGFDPVTIIVRGKHDTGKTTLANLIKMFLQENGYKDVEVEDVEPLPQEEKDRFFTRFQRNRELRPVKIKVELVAEDAAAGGLLTETANYDEPGSWGRMSVGWSEISVRANDVFVFANCVESVPYGSYVLVEDILRVHPNYVDRLRSDFKAAGEPSSVESAKRRNQTGQLKGNGLREKAPKWW